MIADFDEEKMNRDFPGMKLDVNLGYFYNDGRMKDDARFMDNIYRVELNGSRLPFGTTGIYIDGNVNGHTAIRFMKHRLKRGDKISIYSTGYDVYHYLVR